MLKEDQIEEILKCVQKPGRYTDGEWNAVRKNPDSVRMKVALAFPDLYEIGMSYLGQKILYSLLNAHPSYLAERVFAPGRDLESVLREKKIPLFSLENKIPLFQFEMIGFSLLYELNYSNVLTILDLGQIPLLAADRDGEFPFIAGGGPCAFNPEPVADFFDFFLLGDGEEAIFEILEIIPPRKKELNSREAILEKMAKIRGVYVPSLYKPYVPAGASLSAAKPIGSVPSKIKKRILYPFDSAPFPEKIVVPNISVVFDRVSVEVARGCPQNCRFCQASSLYFPSRNKDPSLVMNTVLNSLLSTGYDEASLSSLSVSDYPYLDRTVEELMKGLEKEKIALSLSSLRPGGLTESLVESIIRVRKTGFTIVPEAGTARLRDVINKKLKDEDIWEAATNAFSQGWRLLKLYFMVGLPTEKEEDLIGIVRLVEELLQLGRRILHRPPQINLSISSFIPKPHTPFQWLKMEDRKTLQQKHVFIKTRLKRNRSVHFKIHPVDSSLLEGVFSRGDRRLNPVLMRAWKEGARFDSWTDFFDFRLWERVFEKEKIDPRVYLNGLPKDAALPWEHVSTGLKKKYLLEELERALEGKTTDSCLEKDCAACSGCSLWPQYEKEFEKSFTVPRVERNLLGKKNDKILRYRAFYSKLGLARFLSHNDTTNILQRGLRRAGLSIHFSEGFHPKMTISYLPAIPLGMAGKEEVLEFGSTHLFSKKEFLSRVNGFLPSGIEFNNLKRMDAEHPSLTEEIQTLVYSIKLEPDKIGQLVAAYLGIEILPDVDNIILLSKKLMAGADDFKPGVVESIQFLPGKNNFVLHIRFDKRNPVRIQDIVSRIFQVENPAYIMTRERVIFKK